MRPLPRRVPAAALATALLLIAGGGAARGKDPAPLASKPTAEEVAALRTSLALDLAALRGEAERAKDPLAADVIEEVRRTLADESPSPASVPTLLGAAAIEGPDRAWLPRAIEKCARAAGRLALCAEKERVAEAQMVRQVPDVVATLRELGRRRVAAGVPPMRWSASGSRGAILHARYLAMAGYEGIAKRPTGFHGEEPNDPFATPEGRLTAGHAVMGFKNALDTLDMLFDTFIHRLPMLVPWDASIGIGTWTGPGGAATVFVNVGDRRADAKPGPTPVLWPPPSAKDASRAFYREGEIPPPILNVDLGSLACPVTASFYGASTVGAAEVRVTSKGADFPAFVIAPDHPLNPNAAWPIHVGQSVGIVGKTRFAPGTAYEVRLRCTVNGAAVERTWSFTTR